MTCASSSSASSFQETTTLSDLGTTHTTNTTSTMQKTGRKTFKLDATNKEAVWPDFMERWLLQGSRRYFRSPLVLSLTTSPAAEHYVPPSPRRGPRKSKLIRFPSRNEFISKYIFKKTGKWRSTKQVASRLQQLRRTSRDPQSAWAWLAPLLANSKN
jgi:TEA/ATTS domain